MQERTRTRRVGYIVAGILVVLDIGIFYAITERPPDVLTVSFMDVGQGDAILVESPTGAQMLVDGGRDGSVLRQLPKHMGPFDRSIDVVVETHPDADHIAGLPGVFDRYAVALFMEPGIPNDTNATLAVDAARDAEPGLQKVLARKGERIDLGGGAYADILFPDRDVSNFETNAGSVVMRVVYGDTSFMLTGDSPSEIEDYLVAQEGSVLKTDVLKAGHHGSKYSTDSAWLAAVQPALVIISAGRNNSYGHPAPETMSRIEQQGAEVLSTLGTGDIVLVSDGKTVTRK